MEGYVFALMANSGTDPELEAEDELEEARKKEFELRYLVKLDENEKEPEARSSANQLVEKMDALIMGEERLIGEPLGYGWKCFVSESAASDNIHFHFV
ncbi:hypothetical protein PoB_003240300 [Plakobranchus ocellatus]|uniref:Uncharacterized protein n=1 Tax=Plakobranchus ocellatus TaxID=259542 RepID=A0AAV4AGI3_9GAST|nr:hypothetical protein PoB_003240300 [Plakobranchus ocellatus]